MKKKYTLQSLIIIAIVGVLIGFFSRSCNDCVNWIDGTDTTITIATEYVTIHDTVINTVPKPFKITELDTVFLIDSSKCQELANKYYSELLYNDTLINDSTLFFAISETIKQNKIIHRSINYMQSERIKTITNTIIEKVKDKSIFSGDIGIVSDFKSLQFAVKIGGQYVYKNNGVRLGLQSNGVVEIGFVRKF